MTNMDLQQYKYRRNFPYNDTIKEDSDEMLSENKSSVTFNSALPKPKIDQKYFQNKTRERQGRSKRQSTYSHQSSSENSPDNFDLKSENIIRNFSNQVNKEHIHIRNLHHEVNSFNKQSSEKYIKHVGQIEDFRVKKVSLIESGLPQNQVFIEMNELEDDVFFQPSQRNSHIDQEADWQHQQVETEGGFPDDEYQSFRRSKAEALIGKWLQHSYNEKLVGSFYHLWDNVQHSILADLAHPFERRLGECFRALKNLPPKRFQGLQIPKPSRYVSAETNNEYLSQTGMSNYQTETNVYIESEFTSMGGSDRQIGGDLGFGGLGASIQRKAGREEMSGHFKNKSNNLEVSKRQAHKKNTFSDELQNEHLTKQNFQNAQDRSPFRKKSSRKELQAQASQNKQSTMRKLRETLEKEQIEQINRDFSKKNKYSKPSPDKFGKKRKSYEFSFANNTLKQDSGSIRNLMRKSSSRLTAPAPEPSAEKKSAIGRVFYLLSRRFQDTQYKNFFLDQVELLVYKHGIRDPQIISLLQNLDLRFDIRELCPEESEQEHSSQRELRSQERVQRRLEKQMTQENMRRLERVMMLFRADQLFAPLIRHFSFRKMSYNRHFFVNLRMFAKLAPFRKLHAAVQRRVHINRRAALSQVLFYVKPNLRLLVMMYAISKVQQRHTVDAFRRIYAFYYERLQKELQERKEKGRARRVNRRKKADHFPGDSEPPQHDAKKRQIVQKAVVYQAPGARGGVLHRAGGGRVRGLHPGNERHRGQHQHDGNGLREPDRDEPAPGQRKEARVRRGQQVLHDAPAQHGR